jgi:hypothetical protein
MCSRIPEHRRDEIGRSPQRKQVMERESIIVEFRGIGVDY